MRERRLAAHTSSSSTKLIHGGLRYLEHYEFSPVRKALQEREVLLRSAPHLIWPLRFVMPHDLSMRPAWMVRIGLFLYDHLARRDLGARVFTHTRCVEARRGERHWTATLDGPVGRTAVRTRAVVNAAGPWAELFLSDVARPAGGRDGGRHLRLVKGSHIVVPRLFTHDHAYLFQNPDKRIIFAIPYESDYTLIGTTDVEVPRDDPALRRPRRRRSPTCATRPVATSRGRCAGRTWCGPIPEYGRCSTTRRAIPPR